MDDGKVENYSPSKSLPDGSGMGRSGGDECDLRCIVPIQNPQLKVIPRISLGSTLQVKIKAEGKQSAIAVYTLGLLVGFIVPDDLPQFLRCIENGVSYKATVVTLDGNYCEVRVQRA
jgi:hypothetical protein